MNINMHTSHPSAFISSTFMDLKQERKAVAQILRENGLNVNALDVKPASSQTSRREIVNGIKESDFVILIVGNRYGSILPQVTGSSTLSITRWEYKKAVQLNKSILVYYKENPGNEPADTGDSPDPDDAFKQEQLKQFKRQLDENHNPKYFSNPDELAREIHAALIPVYRDGLKLLLSRQRRRKIRY
ncbi:DUF4062 domain-containing protein [Desulfoluna spongiiphila]|uniref:DUF4062 domain-containing protein n=1 Tax=Desulfoluna spongiiphila TaxID=419481 RepID=UPI001251B4EE|nr:DUF4062 domain-containing protein [Desulfoluna spongiiphila]VVS92541.1 domain of unknown function duf4062 [Desulfoluna spongiiphila]